MTGKPDTMDALVRDLLDWKGSFSTHTARPGVMHLMPRRRTIGLQEAPA